MSHNNLPPSFIVFDFDGVIADSFNMTLTLCNQLADEYGFAKINPEQQAELRHSSTREILTKHLKVAWYQIPSLHKKFTQLLQHHMLDVPLAEGISCTIKRLKERGYRLCIISSNAEDNIRLFLKHHNIDHFDVIFAGSSLFGKHRVINRFLKKLNLKPHDILYIGDEVRDIEACKKSEVHIVAATWGFNAHEILAKHAPNHLITHPSELFLALEKYTLDKK